MPMTSPLTRIAIVVLMTSALAGCARREELNADCHLAAGGGVALDLSNAYQQRHLAGDAQLAEERAGTVTPTAAASQ
jgi:hypothetical protein